MAFEDQLREKLRKVEALFFGAATAGEQTAAGAAAQRLKAKLAEAVGREAATELMFTMPDSWSAQLFIALCRRYGFKPYRYARQRRTTVMVRAPRRVFDEIVWRQFVQLHDEMQSYFEETTEKLIRESVHPDAADAETVAEPAALRG